MKFLDDITMATLFAAAGRAASTIVHAEQVYMGGIGEIEIASYEDGLIVEGLAFSVELSVKPDGLKPLVPQVSATVYGNRAAFTKLQGSPKDFLPALTAIARSLNCTQEIVTDSCQSS